MDAERKGRPRELDSPDVHGQRPSGVYESPTARPAMPVRVAYLLRAGLRPPERAGVVTLIEPTADARPMNAYVVDTQADRALVLARIAASLDAQLHWPALPAPLLLCGPCDAELADAALGARVDGLGVDLAEQIDRVARVAGTQAHAHASADPASKLAWYHAGLSEWVAALYADLQFTAAQLRVLALLGLGVTVADLAGLLGCTEGMIHRHTQNMRDRTGQPSTDALLARMQRRIRIQPDPALVLRTPPRVRPGMRTPPDGCPM